MGPFPVVDTQPRARQPSIDEDPNSPRSHFVERVTDAASLPLVSRGQAT